jgi:hypothetical protein
LQSARIVPLLSNGVIVISETGNDLELEKSFRNTVFFADRDAVLPVCRASP